MALCRTVGLLARITKPALVDPCFVIPSSVNMPLRYGKRKGYRQMAQKKKRDEKLGLIEVKRPKKIRMKVSKFEKTVEKDKPDIPNDDIFIMSDFKDVKYSISEAVELHREYHHPTVYNNPEAPVNVKLEIDMTGKKVTQVIKPFSGIVPIPHQFLGEVKKSVLVLCNPSDAEMALQCGASMAGGVDIIKKIQGGVIHTSLYDIIICHVNLLPELTPIRNILKDQMPKVKQGTLTSDLKFAINRLLHGTPYKCVSAGSSTNIGVLSCKVGTINMELQHLEENFKAIVSEVLKHRPVPNREFITWVWCTSPPSDERFAVDMSLYIETDDKKKAEAYEDEDDDDEDDAVSEKDQEAMEMKKLKGALEE